MEYYSAMKKEEIAPFAPTWMGLEMIIPSEDKSETYQVRDRRTNTVYHLHVEPKL